MSALRDAVIWITGASRGIGRAIALDLAAQGARVVLLAKSERPHPKLEGTIGETARAVEALGGTALPIKLDVREEHEIEAALARTLETFGRLDGLIHNAGAIHLATLAETPLRRFDLLHEVNARAAFALSQICLPALRRAPRAQMLFLAPPIDLAAHWIEGRVAYTMSKYGVSLLVRGLAEELRSQRIAVHALWPARTIATAAVQMLGGEEWMRRSRRPAFFAEAVRALFLRPDPLATSGRWYLDEEVLREAGVHDFRPYAVDPTLDPLHDLYVADGPSIK
ncbi:MAG: SDR family oxidoreductase [Planctomycetes bacterium]|nr:SDR family oxidoreductase [Planctomycetota bacterium]